MQHETLILGWSMHIYNYDFTNGHRKESIFVALKVLRMVTFTSRFNGFVHRLSLVTEEDVT